eukprot:TRINITY_DN53046_c0_g1_i1.p1 TRINITY_DN53046_c0_g1~~TRINITY_DN53046_c0_g1_i1.p1  ORF type:complete len:119 (+),score=9.11 TRINITY_DN53046_c0_g1_i1:49-357(+)
MASSTSGTVTASPGKTVPEGIPQLTPSDPPSPSLAPQVADCIANPLIAQFTWDTLTTLVECCRRERLVNYEAVRHFPKQGPHFEATFDGHDRPDLLNDDTTK